MNDETILDQDLSPTTYLVASEIHHARERAIEIALDYFFKTTPANPYWDEESLAELGRMTHNSNGTEIFSMGETDLVKFGAVISKIEIDRNCALATYTMEIQELYK
jgi:hypothetical protein